MRAISNVAMPAAIQWSGQGPRFAITPIRVVVELEHGDFAKLDALSRGDCAREFLRLLALQAIETHAVLMPRVRQRDGSLRPKAY